MPKQMPAPLTAAKNQLSQPGAWVWLLTVTLPNGGPTLRYASNTEDVVYGGQTYAAFNFSIDSFSVNTDGELPELEMRVTNVGYAIQDIMRDYSGLIGGTVSYVQVNTDYLAESYDNDAVTLRINGAVSTWPDISLTLGVPSEIRARVPENRQAPHTCPHQFRDKRCGYAGQSISAVTLSGENPVQIQVASGYVTQNITGITYHPNISFFGFTIYVENWVGYNPIHVTVANHGFTTGETINIQGVAGITPTINGPHRIRVVDANRFQLTDTDGADYTGTWTAGGTAGKYWGGHGLSTGDDVTIESVAGITPSLSGHYQVTVINTTTFTLNGTKSSFYSGAYTSGGKAGFRYCCRNAQDCSARGLYPHRFGGPIALRRNAVRFL